LKPELRNFVGARTFPQDLSYHRPADLAEALELLAAQAGTCTVLAGGTDVLPMVRRGALSLASGARLVDVTRLPGFRDIEHTGGRLLLGAAVTLAELTTSPAVREHAPLLAEAAGKMASPQLRNTATIGGNLCTASPGADTAPPLLALDGEAIVRSRERERVVPLTGFFSGPGQTVLGPGELLVGVRCCAVPAQERTAHIKLERRSTFALSILSVAVRLALEGGLVRVARIALGAAAPTPLRATRTEQLLTGRPLDEEALEAAAREVADEIRPRSSARASAEYRRDLAGVLLKRALRRCAGE
jgi:carbon-monoxide dehydrogenase medium subunit